MLKTCTHCNEEKLIIEFAFCNKKGGYTNLCKKCRNDSVNSDNKKIRKATGSYKGYSNFQIN